MATQPHEVRAGGGPAAARAREFVGECFAFGAVCGLVVELARSTRRRRHG